MIVTISNDKQNMFFGIVFKSWISSICKCSFQFSNDFSLPEHGANNNMRLRYSSTYQYRWIALMNISILWIISSNLSNWKIVFSVQCNNQITIFRNCFHFVIISVMQKKKKKQTVIEKRGIEKKRIDVNLIQRFILSPILKLIVGKLSNRFDLFP